MAPLAVTVVVPFTPGDPDRDRAWEWIREQYAERHPDWTVIEAHGQTPWSKGAAVAPAIAEAPRGTVIIADADVWCDRLPEAVHEVSMGIGWAIPHHRVHRLTKQATLSYIEGADPERLPVAERAYYGCPGGGIVVLPTRIAQDIPIDPRFVGWGGEDRAWGWALECFHGGPWVGGAPLWHLWHQPQERQTRNLGNAANEALKQRYDAARCDQAAMRQLLEEARRGA